MNALPSATAAPVRERPAATARFLAHLSAVPSMPEVGAQLVRWMGREDVSLFQVADLIGRDQGLAAKVLRLANSARYGSRGVVSLRDAAALIGQRGLRDLALVACFAQAFPFVKGFDRERYWCRCLATAGYARAAAQGCGLDGDAAYLAGLLLPVGQLLLLLHDPAGATAVVATSNEPDTLAAREIDRWGCSHRELSAGVARHWGMPPALVHSLESACSDLPAEPMGQALRAAAVLADAGDLQLQPWPTLRACRPWLAERLAAAGGDALAEGLPSYEQLTLGVEQLLV